MRRSSIDYVRQFIREEISRRPVRPVAEAENQGSVDAADPASGKTKNTTGSIDSVSQAIAKKMGKPELAGILSAAIKKAKGGKDAEDLSTSDKNALADVFLQLIFTDPKATAEISQQLKKISVKKQ